jgi:hypothetical protein
MNLVKTTFDFPAANNTWDAVRYWAGMSARFKQADLTCQVMAGFALTELRRTFHAQGKRTDLTSPNDSAKLAANGDAGWTKLVRENAGISEDTARNWMRMAEGIKGKWRKLGVADQVKALMSVPPSQWNDEEAKLIQSAVHKVTDGKTQLEFMWELGIAKKPQGSGATGRAPGEGGRKKLTMSETAELLKAGALADWEGIAKLIGAYKDKFLLLTDADVTAQIALLERQLNARKAWLKQPRDARAPKAITPLLS